MRTSRSDQRQDVQRFLSLPNLIDHFFQSKPQTMYIIVYGLCVKDFHWLSQCYLLLVRDGQNTILYLVFSLLMLKVFCILRILGKKYFAIFCIDLYSPDFGKIICIFSDFLMVIYILLILENKSVF